MLPAFLTTLLFAISGVSATRTAKRLGGVEANFWRITLATLFLGSYALTVGKGISGHAFVTFLLSGCVGFGIGDLALYQALPRLGSRLSIMLVHCLAAPFAGLVEWLWLGTTLSAGQILSSFIILAGVALALAPGKHLNLSPRTLAVGVSFGILAAGGQGFGAVLSRKAYQVAQFHGESIDGISAAYQRILAGWVVALLFLAITKWRAHRETPAIGSHFNLRREWSSVWYWILINALSGPALGVSCYQWALASTPTAIVLPIVAITPIVIIPFSRFIEGEEPSMRSLAGGVIAVVGAIALTMLKR